MKLSLVGIPKDLIKKRLAALSVKGIILYTLYKVNLTFEVFSTMYVSKQA